MFENNKPTYEDRWGSHWRLGWCLVEVTTENTDTAPGFHRCSFHQISTFESDPSNSSCDLNSSRQQPSSIKLMVVIAVQENHVYSVTWLLFVESNTGEHLLTLDGDADRVEGIKPPSTPALWRETKAVWSPPWSREGSGVPHHSITGLKGQLQRECSSPFTSGNGYKLPILATDFLAYAVVCSQNAKTFIESEHKIKRQNPTSKTAGLLIPCNAPS